MISLIVILPFLSALIMGVVYLSNTDKKRYYFYSTVGILSPAISTIITFLAFYELYQTDIPINYLLFEWINIENFNISFAFRVDKLSATMLLFISLIGTIIHIYASGYMKDDESYGRFFSYFNFFMGSMFLLILANNPVIMFIGWELVGLSSYLLIGFYHKNTQNIKSANKAFILNRIGDFAFIIAMVLLFVSLDIKNFDFLSIEANIQTLDNDLLSLIGILLFVGAMGKSAQIPLYVWLPDAMAGPTPVSALIHAATMVTAGVYMVARYSFLYIEIPDIGIFIASIGAGSALFAAIIASYQSDIKKILAYSTMSQLGYMFIAVGLGAYSSGIFHVFTHAFFKALLFMGAGAVIIAMNNEQNIFTMGGLKKHLKLIYITMLIATLSISAIPPFSGFFSKDAIIITAFASEHYIIWGVASFTAFLTAFYMFRMFFLVFHTDNPKIKKLRRVSRLMSFPLVLLSLGCVFTGFLHIDNNSWLNLPNTVFSLSELNKELIAGFNILLGFTGVFIAYKMFANNTRKLKQDSLLKKVIINKFYVDEIYEFLFIKPILLSSKFISNVVEPRIFDGVLRAGVFIYMRLAILFSMLQNAKIRYYALYMLIGISSISLYMIFKFEDMK